MPRVDNKGISIHYRVEGNGPPLILQHGFSDSSDRWFEHGYVAALKQKYLFLPKTPSEPIATLVRTEYSIH